MLFTKRDITKIVFPLIIEQLLSVTIGLFDSIMVSSAGDAAISGVSLVDSVNLLFSYLFSALATGGAVVVSQCLGKRDPQKATHASKQLVLTVFAAAVLLSAVVVCFRNPLLHLIFGKVEADVMANARIYFLITALSYPFLGLYNASAAIFRSVGNSKISMTASLMMNIINVSGNAFFIFVCGWGAAGAATATLIARAAGAALMMALLHGKKHNLRISGLLKTRPDFAVIKNICRIGIPSGIENSMFQFGKVITQSLISSFGTVQIAANAAANSLSGLQHIPGSAVNLAVITIVGRCIGAMELGQAKSYSRKLLGMSYGSIWAASALIFVLLRPILSIYNLSPASTDLAYDLMVMHTIAVSTIWPLSFSTPNSFRAAGDVKFPLVVSSSSMWIFRVGLSYVFGKFLGLGVVGVWLAMFSDWAFRATVYSFRYFKGIWLKKIKLVA